jgi:UDP-N-acetylmuramate--alanine ligase
MIDLSRHHRIHFVGVGGIGMSGLARYLHARRFAITGSDRAANDQTESLKALGIPVAIGHDAGNLGDADLVILSSAVPADNPEILAAQARGLPTIKRSVLLAAIMNPLTGIAVAGTHGKSTTSALIAHLLLRAGRDVTVLIGGVSTNLGSNARTGESELVVVEADEYDASFLQLRPVIGVITNVGADHLDFYETLGKVHSAFRAFAEAVSGLLVVCADDLTLRYLVGGVPARLVTYGLEAGEWRAHDIVDRDGRTEFTAARGNEAHRLNMLLAGAHNVRNALAAIAVADAMGVSMDEIASGLAAFTGVQRRFEIKGEAGGVLVMDDYAVHPTEIHAILSAMRSRFGRPIRVIFQPHTFSRPYTLRDEFATAFEGAEAVYVTDIYAAREQNVWGITGQDLAAAIAAHHPDVHFTGSLEDTLARVAAEARPGDLVVTVGAGNVTSLGPRLLAVLGSRPSVLPVEVERQ